MRKYLGFEVFHKKGCIATGYQHLEHGPTLAERIYGALDFEQGSPNRTLLHGPLGGIAQQGIPVGPVGFKGWKPCGEGVHGRQSHSNTGADIAADENAFSCDDVHGDTRTCVDDKAIGAWKERHGTGCCCQSIWAKGFGCIVPYLEGQGQLVCKHEHFETRGECSFQGLFIHFDAAKDGPTDFLVVRQPIQGGRKFASEHTRPHQLFAIENASLVGCIANVNGEVHGEKWNGLLLAKLNWSAKNTA